VRDWRKEEKRAIEKSDAAVTVANEILKIAKGHSYRMPEHTLIYPNYLPGKYVPEEILEKK